MKRLLLQLNSLQIDGNVSISRFTTAFQRYHPGEHAPLFKVILEAAANEQLLLNIRTIGYCSVRIERMNKSAVVQCRRCQRFHHTTGQCHYFYRCVQCASEHEYGQCPRSINCELAVGCINCKQAGFQYLGHTANDLKNCSFFLKTSSNRGNTGISSGNGSGLIRVHSRTATSNVSVKPSISNNSVSHGERSYAAMVKASSPLISEGRKKVESTINWNDEARIAVIVAAVIKQLRRDGH